MTTPVDPDRLRVWLLERLGQPAVQRRLLQFATLVETLSGIPAEAMTEADLGPIWLDVRNAVSELPSTSGNLYNTQRPAVLRAATAIAQQLTHSPASRLVGLFHFFRVNGEPTAQLSLYVRAAALFDPGHVPTVIAYRTLPGAMLETLGYTGQPTPWERLIQEDRVTELDAAFRFAFDFIAGVLPNADVYERAVALELTPGFVKDQARLEGKPIAPTAAYVAPPPAPLPPRPDRSEHRPRRDPSDSRRRGPRPRRED